MKRLLIVFALLSALLLTACGAPATPPPTATPVPTATATLSPEALEEAIFAAAREDDVDAMKRYIAAGADINKSDEFGATVLSVAAYRSNVEMVRLLLDSGATFDIEVFHHAVIQSNDNTEVVEAFIVHGVDVDEPTNASPQHNALMYAAEYGHVEVGRLLLVNGADINKVAQFNDPALNIAAAYGQLEFVKMLVEMGAELNIPGVENRTALGHALYYEHEEVADFLIEVGATE